MVSTLQVCSVQSYESFITHDYQHTEIKDFFCLLHLRSLILWLFIFNLYYLTISFLFHLFINLFIFFIIVYLFVSFC